MRLQVTLGALASIALAFGGCFLPGFDVGGAGGSDSSTASSAGGAGGAGAAPPQLCESEGLPPRPQGTSGAGGSGGAAEAPLRFALRNFDFGDDSPADPPGLDLDGTCTCCECVSNKDACPLPSFGGKVKCDGPRGVDNAFANILNLPGLNAGSNDLNIDVNAGRWTILVEIRDYDGLPDDDQITIALYTTSGHKTDPSTNVLPTPPAWDGSDVWMRRADSVGPGGEPLVYTDKGYVRDRVAVGELAGVLALGGAFDTLVRFQGGLVRVRLAEVEGKMVLREGVIGGRWPLTDIFDALGSLRLNNAPVCTDSPFYGIAKGVICGAVDVYSRGDGINPCDALSFGMSFDAEPVDFAAALGPVTASPGCAPELDPANDCCERVSPTDPCPP